MPLLPSPSGRGSSRRCGLPLPQADCRSAGAADRPRPNRTASTKYGSEGTCYLAPSLADPLTEHVVSYCPDGDWLFTGQAGETPHGNTVGHRWRATFKSAGLSGVKLHDLRHFHGANSRATRWSDLHDVAVLHVTRLRI
jgi:integrase